MEEEEISDTEEAAKIETHRLAGEEEATKYADYGRDEQMQVDEREDTGGKSAPRLQIENAVPEATPMAVKVLGQTDEEKSLEEISRGSESPQHVSKEWRTLSSTGERATNLQHTRRDGIDRPRIDVGKGGGNGKNQHHNKRRGGPARTGGDSRTN